MAAPVCAFQLFGLKKRKKKEEIPTYRPIFFQTCYSKHNFFVLVLDLHLLHEPITKVFDRAPKWALIRM